MRITLLVSELEIVRDRIVCFKESSVNEHTENRKVAASRQKTHVALKDSLRDEEGTLRWMLAKSAVAAREQETLCLREERVGEKLSIARTDLSLQTTR